MLKLEEEWKHIVKKAWSFRLLALAGVLSGIEIILPMFETSFPRGVFAAISFAVTCSALVARVVAQPKMDEAISDKKEQNG
jgi:hypothetical protein